MIKIYLAIIVKIIFDLMIMLAIVYGVMAACLGSKLYEIIRYIGGN